MKRIVLIWLALLTAWPSAADAQRGARREQLREKIKAVRMARLVTALDLDQQAAARLVPVLDKGYDEIAEVARDSGAARRELRAQLAVEKPDETRINQLVNRLVASKGRVNAIQLAMVRDARRVLTPRQAGQLVLVLPEIDRELRQRIRQAAKGPGNGSGGDDPDDPY